MKISLDKDYLAEVISKQTGFVFKAETGVDEDGQCWYLLRPKGILKNHAFGIRTTIGWRRLRIDFEPGKFAGSLLANMGETDLAGQTVFIAVIDNCKRNGAQIEFKVNGVGFPYDSNEVWNQKWNRLLVSMNKGQLQLGAVDDKSDSRIICEWTARFSAAICAILPTEEQSDYIESSVEGYPEGTLISVKVKSV